MLSKKISPSRSIKTMAELEQIYHEFESRLRIIKQEKDAAVDRIMKKIDDQKIKLILSKIK